MTTFKRFLVENWAWWAVPLIVVLGLVAWIVFNPQPDGLSSGQDFQYDLH